MSEGTPRETGRNDGLEQAEELGARLTEGERPTRKNHYLYQSKIDMAREILGAKTETDALNGALDLLIYGEALARGTEAMAGEEYVDVLGLGDDVPASCAERE
jgi:hypothetical protein